MKESIGNLHEVKVLGPAGPCPDEATLAEYTGGSMTPWQRERLEEHASACVHCLENIRAGQAAETMLAGGALTDTGENLKNKAKGLAKMDMGKRRLQSYIWLAATIAAFTLSFTAPKYFAQLLVAALILGLKWVSESEGIRTLIVSMDAKRRHEGEREEISKWRR
jgi:hypothetical protein